jgi:hypothetical protein
MATEPFTCADCGWPEEKHGRDIPVADRQAAAKNKHGFGTSLAKCTGYRAPPAERKSHPRPAGRGDEEAAWTP